jgi:hypothetical protein
VRSRPARAIEGAPHLEGGRDDHHDLRRACVGEMSSCSAYHHPPTSSPQPSVVAVIQGAPALLDRGGLTMALAQLAGRLPIVDHLPSLKHQYAVTTLAWA